MLLFLSPIGLFYELQNNNIQAEMAFREAKKLLQAQLNKERSIPEAAEGEEGKKHISAGCVRSPSPGPGECLPGNTGKTRKCPSTSKEGAWSSVGDGEQWKERRNF